MKTFEDQRGAAIVGGPKRSGPPAPTRVLSIGVAATIAIAALIAALVLVTRVNDQSSSDAKPKAPVATVVVPKTPTDAAQQLYFAWQRDSLPEAARVATSEASKALFALKSTEAAGLAFGGCTVPSQALSICSWSRDDGRLAMRVSVPKHGAPKVLTAEMR